MLLSLLILYFISTASADAEYLAERFAYYSLKLRNTSMQAYSPSAYTTCDYVDVCESDLDKIVWTVSFSFLNIYLLAAITRSFDCLIIYNMVINPFHCSTYSE
jgi:hypothetical protein